MKIVFVSLGSEPGRIAYTFSSGIGFPEVRSEVDSNLSTTTCSFPPESFAISFNCAAIASRAQPIPRFGSVQEESVSRVPQPTKLWISPRIDFSSMLCRAIAPKGRGRNFTCGFPCGGSAGSRAVCCAKAGTAAASNSTSADPLTFRASPTIVLLRFLMCSPTADLLQKGIGILARTRRDRHRANPFPPVPHLNACESPQII